MRLALDQGHIMYQIPGQNVSTKVTLRLAIAATPGEVTNLN